MPDDDKTYSAATAGALAAYVADFFAALVAKGMKRKEAMKLTVTWLSSIVMAGRPK